MRFVIINEGHTFQHRIDVRGISSVAFATDVPGVWNHVEIMDGVLGHDDEGTYLELSIWNDTTQFVLRGEQILVDGIPA